MGPLGNLVFTYRGIQTEKASITGKVLDEAPQSPKSNKYLGATINRYKRKVKQEQDRTIYAQQKHQIRQDS